MQLQRRPRRRVCRFARHDLRRRHIRSRARRPSASAAAAPYSSGRANSRPISVSASRCLTAWNDPIATPNWVRCFTYATVARSSASPVPSACAAVANAAQSAAAPAASTTRGPEASTCPPGSTRNSRRAGSDEARSGPCPDASRSSSPDTANTASTASASSANVPSSSRSVADTAPDAIRGSHSFATGPPTPLSSTAAATVSTAGPGTACRPSQVQALFAHAEQAHGSLDIVVNNAGLGGTAELTEMTDAQWSKVLDVTLNGTFRCTRAALRSLRSAGRGGVVVNNASVVGWRAQAGQAHYAAAKAGVMALTRCAAVEAAAYGVRVNAVAPSLAMHPHLVKVTSAGLLDELTRKEAFGRYAEPWEIANVIVFLASGYSSYMTGEVVSVSSRHA